jgi:predicted phage terminase large subunit-like protein
VQQRLHVTDLAGFCLDLGYTPVVLPAVADQHTAVRSPRSGRLHERAAGDVLWPVRFPAAYLDEQRRLLGSSQFAAQYQQQPAAEHGGMFDPAWWRYYDELPRTPDQWIQSWDMAFKGGDQSDYVVGLVAARIGHDIFLVDREKGRFDFVQTLDAMRRVSAQYPSHAILVEDTANGPAVIAQLTRELAGLIPVAPQGGKVARAAAVSPTVESGHVFLPNPVTPSGVTRWDRQWVSDFRQQLAQFPNAKHDDDVDAFSQLVLRCLAFPGSSEGYRRWLTRRQLARHEEVETPRVF